MVVGTSRPRLSNGSHRRGLPLPAVVLIARQTLEIDRVLDEADRAVGHGDVDAAGVPAPRGVHLGQGRRRDGAGRVRRLVDAIERAEEHVGERAVGGRERLEGGGVAPPGEPPQVLALADDDLGERASCC